ncbi:MAG TPA: glycosyltransferase family 9 protein, partial [Opitutaceae bacterium]|nr:glycosyltransferase family 9 protein [Opitutaceae bacterium]
MSAPVEPRVLVMRRRYLGDVVLLGALFRNLRLHWPHAHLAALVEPNYAGVLDLNPDVNEKWVLPKKMGAWPLFLARLRSAGFTHVFDLDNNDRTAWLSRVTGAKFRAVVWHEGTQPRWKSLYTHQVYDPPEIHENRSMVEYYLSILAAANVPITTRTVRLIPRSSDIEAISRYLGPTEKIRPAKILIHPGSRSRYRLWPAENFAAVSDLLQDKLGANIFLAGGGGERALIEEIKGHAKLHIVSLDGPLPVSRFAALASQVDLMLCHD